LRGYIKASDKQQIQNRLRRIEEQVRGLQRMVEEEAYCVEVLTQIASIVSASEKVALILLEDHIEHCVQEAIADGERAENKVAELSAAVERFLRVQDLSAPPRYTPAYTRAPWYSAAPTPRRTKRMYHATLPVHQP
jgi:CsoR family transcriptional regulator, copper-sensing transcriptional repressor